MSAGRSKIAAVLVLALATFAAGCGGVKPLETGDGAAEPASCSGPRTAASDGWVTPIARHVTPALPATITDFTGEGQTIRAADRVLALDTYGTLATTVYALGLGDRLVGRDVSTGVPALQHLPVVTHNGHELNAEAILDLDPDVILTDYSIGPLEVQLQLQDAGIPVIIMDAARNRAVIPEQIRAVAAALGVPRQGEQLVDQVKAGIADAEAEVAELAPSDPKHRIRMVFLYMRGTAGVYYWFGRGSGADDLIDALDGVDVATEAGLAGARALNAEGLVKSAPDLFLMMTHGLESVGGVDGLLDVAGVADTTAGADGCVVDMDDAQILSFGPQFPATLRALAEAIYGRTDRT